MRYLLLIYSPESHYMKMSPPEMGALMAEWGRFHEEIAASGVLEGSDRLQPTATASTLRLRAGKAATTDGPFAETKEQLGGYYLIRVQNLDEALAWAAKIPSARVGSIEVRPIWEAEDYMK
jgi:hypothetical protein